MRNHVWYYISMFNHSCIPNAFVLQYDGTIGYDVRSRVAIPANTEVTINYSPKWEEGQSWGTKPVPETTAVRKAWILESWKFECRCDACSDEARTDWEYARMHAIRDEIATTDFDIDSKEDRDKYAGLIIEYVPLLRRHNLVMCIHKATTNAVEFMRPAIGKDDIAKGFTIEWERAAVDLGVSTHGLETMRRPGGARPTLGANYVESTSTRTNAARVSRMARQIPEDMVKRFKDPVMPGSTRGDDDEDDDDDDDDEDDDEDDEDDSEDETDGDSQPRPARKDPKNGKSTGPKKVGGKSNAAGKKKDQPSGKQREAGNGNGDSNGKGPSKAPLRSIRATQASWRAHLKGMKAAVENAEDVLEGFDALDAETQAEVEKNIHSKKRPRSGGLIFDLKAFLRQKIADEEVQGADADAEVEVEGEVDGEGDGVVEDDENGESDGNDENDLQEDDEQDEQGDGGDGQVNSEGDDGLYT